jgi:hypothetical protein
MTTWPYLGARSAPDNEVAAPLDLLGLSDAMALLGVSRSTVERRAGLRKGDPRRDPDFPAPTHVDGKPIWDGPTLRAYAEARRGM